MGITITLAEIGCASSDLCRGAVGVDRRPVLRHGAAYRWQIHPSRTRTACHYAGGDCSLHRHGRPSPAMTARNDLRRSAKKALAGRGPSTHDGDKPPAVPHAVPKRPWQVVSAMGEFARACPGHRGRRHPRGATLKRCWSVVLAGPDPAGCMDASRDRGIQHRHQPAAGLCLPPPVRRRRALQFPRPDAA